MRLVVADTSPIFYLLSIVALTSCRGCSEESLFPTPCTRSYAILRPQRWFVNGRHVFLSGWRRRRLKLLTMPHSGRWERGSAPLLRSRCLLHGDLILIDERKGANVALAKGSKSPAHSASAAWPQAWPCAPIQARATPFG
jgi:hypothetical protein